MAASNSDELNAAEALFPADRVSTIMRSSPGVKDVSDEAVYVISKAAEKFIRQLARCAYANSSRNGNLEYEHVSDVAQTTDVLEFVREIMPKKMTYLEYKQIMEKKKKENPSMFSEVEDLNDLLERTVKVEGSVAKETKELCEASGSKRKIFPDKKTGKGEISSLSQKGDGVDDKSLVKPRV